ncbi:glycosyltransferase family 4 protein [Brachymonas denitrificans]|uniref:glycosyltransferase family 4 protein n=1 Tax=Brachymonas denitrificans TaxID=28220 RepID=UPI00321F9BD4
MKPRILINCSNLHNGGGVAVATSVVDCLSRMDHRGFSISVLLSTPVSSNLHELGTNFSVFASCQTRDFYGISALWKKLDSHFKGFDLVFTVFGPAYYAHKNTRHLFGFAQPNIVYPENASASRLPTIARWRSRLKFELQACFFARADELVVELEHVRKGLSQRRLFKNKPIHVVYSSVHTVFNEPSLWAPVRLPEKSGRLRLGIISRNYPHKNLAVLAEVKDILLHKHGLDVDMFVTFLPDEWNSCDQYFRDRIINVGGLSLSQCPTFYAAMDGVVFPSLLECFSAVPIETMRVGRPLFASNLSFIRDVCEEHCQYFNPLDPNDIAQVIFKYYSKPAAERQHLCDKARIHVQRYPGPEQRASNYLDVIQKALTDTL